MYLKVQAGTLMKPTRSRREFGTLNWRLVLFWVLFGVAWGTIPGVYQRWMARRSYNQRYSKLLELPSSLSRPRAYLARMPGVIGRALCIDFYEPNADEDDKLRAWFVQHDGFSEFRSVDRLLPKQWEAARGMQFLIVGREDQSGWVHMTLGQRMPPDEAKRDLDNFPWESALQENQRRRGE